MRVYIGPFKKNSDQRKIEVRIDKYDTWNMDSTLAYIILPMLKQLKETKHGSPWFEEFDQTSNSVQYCFDFYAEGDSFAWEKGHERWNQTLDKIIWSFEQINTDWESQFHSGETDVYHEEVEDTEYSGMKLGVMREFDSEGHSKFQERMQEGFELFGKYYRNLWD